MPAQATTPVLVVRDLHHAYGSAVTLSAVNFTAQRGEVIAILGVNGAGKSTLLSIIAGLRTQTRGEVTVASNRDRRRSVGYAAEPGFSFPDLTVFEQLFLAARCFELSASQATTRATRLLQRLGLQAQRDKLGRSLSGGMLQRLNVALALVGEPSLLLFDEPAARLDPENKAALYACIQQERARGATILVSTHDIEDVTQLADRVLIIHEHTVAAFGTPRELLQTLDGRAYLELDFNSATHAPDRRLQRWADIHLLRASWQGSTLSAEIPDILSPLPALTAALAAADLHPVSLRTRKVTLADAFFTITGQRLLP
jgi:ABC-2 type transport system ATP-binding protein